MGQAKRNKDRIAAGLPLYSDKPVNKIDYANVPAFDIKPINQHTGIKLFDLEKELKKMLSLPKVDYSTKASLSDFDNLFPWNGTYDTVNMLDVGFIFAVVSPSFVEIAGMRKQTMCGVTIVSSYCTANNARKHYATLCNLPGVQSITYSTPQQLMILLERV